jgi:esterase/lipase superfamily enzyme
MNKEYHKWWSPSLGRDMELLVYGHGGFPQLAFPSSRGRFFDYENNGMIGAIHWQYEQGRVQTFSLDSIDVESWYNRSIHPADRVRRHMAYESYVLNEVIPLVRQKNWSSRIGTTGCSFGGYFALNFALKYPWTFTDCISMSGAFDIRRFLDGYYDDSCYFNNPPDYLAGMSDHNILQQYRNNSRLVLATSEWDPCLDENWRMARIMGGKQIPHWMDVWGAGVKHDWPYWREMAKKYLG